MEETETRSTGIMIKRAYEISAFCIADVYLGVRFRDTGRIMTFCADNTGIWSEFVTYLVFHSIPSISKLTSTGFVLSHPPKEIST